MSVVSEQLGCPGVAIAAGLFYWGAVVSQLMGLDAGQQIGALPDKEQTLAPEGAQRALVGRIRGGRRGEVSAQEVGEFFGVDAVVLVLAPVNGLEVEGVSQDEGQAGGLTGIGPPIT